MVMITHAMLSGFGRRLRDLTGAGADPRVVEDCRSALESLPYYTALVTEIPPVPCPLCSMIVGLVKEAETALSWPVYTEAAWELDSGQPWRKHTRRRCAWIQANGPA